VHLSVYLLLILLTCPLDLDSSGSAIFDPQSGRITGGVPGTLVFRYAYDGLGRLIAKEVTAW
jgi:hypothetical protein